MRLTAILLATTASAQFFNNFFGQQQQQQQRQPVSYQDDFLDKDCKGYLCPGTQECVKTALDCACPFPSSQLKCVLPDHKNYVCISKPATNNDALNAIYDDPVRGPKAKNDGLRDCGWVEKAYKGLV